MAGLAGKPMDLVLDRRAIARAHALDHAGEHRRAIQAAADDLVGALVGMRDPARQLPRVHVAPAEEREHRLRRSRLAARPSPRNRSYCHPAAAAYPVFRRPTGSFISRKRAARVIDGRVARAARLVALQADVDQAGQEGAGGQDDRAPAKAQPDLGHDTGDPVALQQDVVDGLLEQGQIRLILKAAYGSPACRAIGRPARAWRVRPGPWKSSASGTGYRPRPWQAPWRRPRASISLTRCPLPIPPIDGLQDIWPRVSMLWVRSSVLHPSRAAARAASVPA